MHDLFHAYRQLSREALLCRLPLYMDPRGSRGSHQELLELLLTAMQTQTHFRLSDDERTRVHACMVAHRRLVALNATLGLDLPLQYLVPPVLKIAPILQASSMLQPWSLNHHVAAFVYGTSPDPPMRQLKRYRDQQTLVRSTGLNVCVNNALWVHRMRPYDAFRWRTWPRTARDPFVNLPLAIRMEAIPYLHRDEAESLFVATALMALACVFKSCSAQVWQHNCICGRQPASGGLGRSCNVCQHYPLSKRTRRLGWDRGH